MRLLKKPWLRKAQALLLAGAMIAATPIIPGISGQDEAYAVSDYWAQPYLQSMVDQGIMGGNANGNLNPSDKITRAEFATMMNRSLGYTEVGNPRKTFSDVSASDWYYDDISIAAYEGYMQGVGDNMAAPTAPITREAAVTMLGRALRLQTDPTLSNSFSDNRTISNWSRPYVNVAVGKGLIGGYSDGSFKPGSSITRAEVAKVLSNLTGTIVDDSRQVRLDYVDGNVTLTSSGGGLRNTVIAGDLYITDGIDTGYILLDNVKVLGQVIVSGSGEANTGDCSIVFRDCDINELYVDVGNDKNVAISTQGNTIIRNTILKSDTYLENDNDSGSSIANLTVDMADGQTANLTGIFDNVVLKGAGNTLNLQKGSASGLTVDEKAIGSKVFLAKDTTVGTLFCDGPASVTGKGDISETFISTNGTVIEQLPEAITIRPGIVANINGQDMDSSTAQTVSLTPQILTGYPKISNENTTSVTSKFKVNKAGKLYWAVVPQGYTAPTPAQLINPNLLGSATKTGNLNVTSDNEIVVDITGLAMGTDYTIYGMLVDSYETQSGIRYADFTTVDNTAPKFTYNLIQAETVKNDDNSYSYNVSATLTVSKDATVYYMVLPSGQTAPSATELVNQKMSAASKGYRDQSKNVTNTIAMVGLSENTKYDVYLIAVDDNGRQSAILKTTVTTDDTTAPEMLTLRDKPGANNVAVTFTTNENCTKIYWALYYANAQTVKDIESSGSVQNKDGLMWYEQDSARDAIIKATGSVQSASNLTSKANTPATLNLSKLTNERYYKLYMVLEDASGNRSVVYTIDTSTNDNVAPTVSISMGATDGTSQYVGTADAPTSLSLVFSEVIRFRNGSTFIDSDTYKNKTQSLDTWIKLYKGSGENIASSSTPLKINWDMVEREVTTATEDSPEHTELTFSISDSTNTALQLHSGETYTFVFTYNQASSVYICDKAAEPNPMRTIPTGSASGGNYKSPTISFGTVDPSVSIVSPGDIGSTLDYDSKEHHIDTSYRVTPTTANNAADENLFYDFYVSANEDINVNVYRKEIKNGVEGNWVMVAENASLTSDASLSVPGGKSTMYTYDEIKHPERGSSSKVYAADFAGQQFNSMPDTILFAVEVSQFNYTLDRESWNGSVDIRLNCIIADKDTLATKANSPTNSHAPVTNVGGATGTKTFTDKVAPTIQCEITDNKGDDKSGDDIGENDVYVTITPDKDLFLYWVAIPNNPLNQSLRKTTTQVYSYIQSQTEPANIYNASGTRIPVMQGAQKVAITGLEPDTQYYVYFVARSVDGGMLTEYTDAAACTTTVTINSGGTPTTKVCPQFVSFKTDKLTCPEFIDLASAGKPAYYIERDYKASDTSKIVLHAYTDKPANVYWTVCTGVNKSAYDTIVNGDSNEIRQPSTSVTNGQLIEQNGSSATASTPNYDTSTKKYMYEATITLTGLYAGTDYWIYILPSNVQDENLIGQWRNYGTFALPDKTPPKISDILVTSWYPGSTAMPGSVTATITFDKTLYLAGGNKLTKAKIEEDSTKNPANPLWTITPDYGIEKSLVDGSETKKTRSYSVSVDKSNDSINYIDVAMDYIDTNNLSGTMTYSNRLYNADGVQAGTLKIVFIVNKSDPANPTIKCTATLTDSSGKISSTYTGSYPY